MKKIFLIIFFFGSVTHSFAAHFILSPSHPKTKEPITVTISLDPDSDELSGISGDFSFPSELFDLRSISLKDSVVNLWPTKPNISKDTYLDGRTHIPFEAIFPGGFRGVRSAYYEGVHPGNIFTVTLLPKKVGNGELRLDNLSAHSFSADAHELPISVVTTPIEVTHALKEPDTPNERQIENTTLQAFITKDPLIASGKWYLMTTELLSPSPIKATYVAESSHSLADEIRDTEWHEATLPYVLFYQDRSKYVHVKILYGDNTYVIRTLPPVENPTRKSVTASILIGIVSVGVFLLLYAKTVLSSSLRHPKKA